MTPELEELNSTIHSTIEVAGQITQAVLDGAEDLISEFLKTIDNSMEGDHPRRDHVEEWLKGYDHMRKLQASILEKIDILGELEKAAAKLEHLGGGGGEA